MNIAILGFGVVGGFNFDRNDLSVALDDKINFSSTVRLPIVGTVAVTGELHIDVVFRHTTLEIV